MPPTSGNTVFRLKKPRLSSTTIEQFSWTIPTMEEEDRFVLLGLSAGLRTLVVCHCFREDDSVIRIISARKAHREERRDYDKRWRT